MVEGSPEAELIKRKKANDEIRLSRKASSSMKTCVLAPILYLTVYIPFAFRGACLNVVTTWVELMSRLIDI